MPVNVRCCPASPANRPLRRGSGSGMTLTTSHFPLPTSHFLRPTSYLLRPTSYFLRPSQSDIFCHRGRRRSSFRAKRCEFGSFHDFSSPPPPTPSSIWPQWRHECPAPRPSPLGAIAPRCGTPGFGDHARRGRGLAVPAGESAAAVGAVVSHGVTSGGKFLRHPDQLPPLQAKPAAFSASITGRSGFSANVTRQYSPVPSISTPPGAVLAAALRALRRLISSMRCLSERIRAPRFVNS